MSLGTLFEMHGEAYFHRLERATLKKLLDESGKRGAVLATGGSIVSDPETFALLREAHAHPVAQGARARPLGPRGGPGGRAPDA